MHFDLTDPEFDLRITSAIIALGITTYTMIIVSLNTRPLLSRSTNLKQVMTNMIIAADYPIGMIPAMSIWVSLEEHSLYAMIFLNVVLAFFPFIAWFFKYKTVLSQLHRRGRR